MQSAQSMTVSISADTMFKSRSLVDYILQIGREDHSKTALVVNIFEISTLFIGLFCARLRT